MAAAAAAAETAAAAEETAAAGERDGDAFFPRVRFYSDITIYVKDRFISLLLLLFTEEFYRKINGQMTSLHEKFRSRNKASRRHS